MAAFNQVLYMTSLVNSLHHLVVQGGAGWLNLNFTWCLFNVLVINYTKSSKKKKKKKREERCHGRLYLTSGVPQEVTYMRNNFIESQALGSISVRQTDQSNEQREKNEETGGHRFLKMRSRDGPIGLLEQNERRRETHVFSVAMRQRHTPSLVRLFLCLKPPSIRSHTYCKNTQHHVHNETGLFQAFDYKGPTAVAAKKSSVYRGVYR